MLETEFLSSLESGILLREETNKNNPFKSPCTGEPFLFVDLVSCLAPGFSYAATNGRISFPVKMG